MGQSDSQWEVGNYRVTSVRMGGKWYIGPAARDTEMRSKIPVLAERERAWMAVSK